MVPDENSMEDPLCNSAIGSMVSLDYVTPDTSVVTPVLQADLQEFLCRCCLNRSQIYLIHEKL